MTFIVYARTQARPTVIKSAQVPFPIPGIGIQLLGVLLCLLKVRRGIGTHVSGQRRKTEQGVVEEPTQPDTLTLAPGANAVHAVIPITRAHQRQAVYPAGRAFLERAAAVFVDRSSFACAFILGVTFHFGRFERFAFQEGQVLLQYGGIAGRADIRRRYIRQPEQVI